MGSATPPKRMTRARAAAASATATTLSTQATKSDRVTKTTKSTKAAATTPSTSTTATTVSAKKPTAAAAKKATSTPAASKKPATTSSRESATVTKPAATKKSAIAAKKPATKTTTKAATTATTTTSTTSTRPATRKRKDRSHESDDEDDLSKEDNKLRRSAQNAVVRKSDSQSEQESKPQAKPEEQDTQSSTTDAATTTTSTATGTTASSAAKAQAPSTATTTSRLRTRKAAQAPKKRGRKAAGLKSAVSRPTSKPAAGVLKKTVSFQEPEKENLPPQAAATAKTESTTTTATGMKAKPVRKPAAASGRTTRAKKKPLSPKKDGQNLPLSRDTPLKPMMKSPIKPVNGMKKLELPTEPALSSVLSSPARRPPTSPFKDAMKSPAKRVDSIPSLIFPSSNTEKEGVQSPSKQSLLQSPAKRPQSALQLFPVSQEQTGAARSPMKMSFLGTPAKRPVSPLKFPGSPVSRVEETLEESSKDIADAVMQEQNDVPTVMNTHNMADEISEDELQYQIRADIGLLSPDDSVVSEVVVGTFLSPIPEAENESSIQIEQLGSPAPQLTFPGRLSAVLPRYADPALKQNPLPAPSLPAPSPQVNDAASHNLESSVTSEPVNNELTTARPEIVSDAMSENQSPAEGCTNTSETVSAVTAKENPSASGAENNDQDTDQYLATPEKQTTDMVESQSDKCDVEESFDATSIGDSSTPKTTQHRGTFALREQDMESENMSDSEDELAFSNKAITKSHDAASISVTQPTTPAPLIKGPVKLSESAIRTASRAIKSVTRTSTMGSWRASSPIKARQTPKKSTTQAEESEEEYSLVEDNDPIVETPSAKGFFDEEMRVREEMETQAAIEALLEADIAAKFDKHDFGITDEDFTFITDDEEMSPRSVRETDQNTPLDRSISEASQEYGDENAVPIDPALMGDQGNLVTPQKRTITSREYHTSSKVPLKRGDDSPPRTFKRRCSTASKISVTRPGAYSNVKVPSQQRASQYALEEEEEADEDSDLPLATPSRSAPWSSVGTPARAPRRDINSQLLSGVVVFVDVHTTEGADAGRVFLELLSSMGARCVKSWPWNPSTNANGQVDVSKIGITHVVFKDGGRRTLEKVLESNGAVECVGVSWVLDCEKENRYLNEKDYRVDPEHIPRGGHNRRKSMEPKAIANKNGTLVTPMRNNSGFAREPQTVPNNYMSRRDSTIWERSPSNPDEDEDAPSEPSEMDWEATNAPILTPVPQTPAPESVANFAMNITPGSPTPSSFASTPGNKLMQTCPPKTTGLLANMGPSFDRNRDPLSMRLMQARRKSMQFAPKIASPLKKQWN
ncbi:hypothetical protein F4808DRAFT_452082 [Astrocystis sublimbata]|nr:hypothetical protein F4808DRAFT_452082 [Astrocystis sublimbata]